MLCIPQRETARHLVADRVADYPLTVKGNQPNLLAACHKLLPEPAGDFAPEHITPDRGHGRTEQRTTRVAPELYPSWITNRRRLERIIAQVEQISAGAGGLLLRQAPRQKPPLVWVS